MRRKGKTRQERNTKGFFCTAQARWHCCCRRAFPPKAAERCGRDWVKLVGIFGDGVKWETVSVVTYFSISPFRLCRLDMIMSFNEFPGRTFSGTLRHHQHHCIRAFHPENSYENEKSPQLFVPTSENIAFKGAKSLMSTRRSESNYPRNRNS